VKLTTHLHLVPKLRIRGAIPPLPQYDMAWCSVKAQGLKTPLTYLVTSAAYQIIKVTHITQISEHCPVYRCHMRTQ